MDGSEIVRKFMKCHDLKVTLDIVQNVCQLIYKMKFFPTKTQFATIQNASKK